jgi:sortase A
MNKRTGYFYAPLIFLCGLWFTGQGAYIHAKALLAQVLLESAWAETLNGSKEVKPWPWADTWPVSRLSVPALGVSRIVLAGASGQSLAFGPGRLFEPGAHGQPFNIVIAGHRDTHFRFLQDLKYGELIRLQTDTSRNLDFTVIRITVVDNRNLDLLNSGARSMLTLVTCYPFDAVQPGGPLRYIVQAEFTGESRDGVI